MQLSENNTSPFPGECLMRGETRPELDKLDQNEARSGCGTSIQERRVKRKAVSPYKQNLVCFNGLSSERPKYKII